MSVVLLLVSPLAVAAAPLALGLGLDTFKVVRNARRRELFRYVNTKFTLALVLGLVGLGRLVARILAAHGEAPLLAGLLLAVVVPLSLSGGLFLALLLGTAGWTVLALNLTSVVLNLSGVASFYFIGWSEVVDLATGRESFWLAFACFAVSTLTGLGGLIYVYRGESMAEHTGFRPYQRAVWAVLTAVYGRLLRALGRHLGLTPPPPAEDHSNL